MKIRFWGTRGSIPTPGPLTLRYGGNTACVEVRDSTGSLLILDAGTGLRELGTALMNGGGTRPFSVDLLLSHLHWDHIQGIPFFRPAYDSKSFSWATVRVLVIPLVSWLWLGGFVVGLGAVIAALPQPRRQVVPERAVAAVASAK